MTNPLYFFRNPTIRAKLVNGGKQVKVALINTTAEQTMIILFLAISQIARQLRMEPRKLMNRIIDLDKTIIKTKKVEERTEKYGHKN